MGRSCSPIWSQENCQNSSWTHTENIFKMILLSFLFISLPPLGQGVCDCGSKCYLSLIIIIHCHYQGSHCYRGSFPSRRQTRHPRVETLQWSDWSQTQQCVHNSSVLEEAATELTLWFGHCYYCKLHVCSQLQLLDKRVNSKYIWFEDFCQIKHNIEVGSNIINQVDKCDFICLLTVLTESLAPVPDSPHGWAAEEAVLKKDYLSSSLWSSSLSS